MNYKQLFAEALDKVRNGSELKEFKNATFIKCYVKNDIDVAVLIHEGVTHVLPLSRVGMLGVSIDKIKQY